MPGTKQLKLQCLLSKTYTCFSLLLSSLLPVPQVLCITLKLIFEKDMSLGFVKGSCVRVMTYFKTDILVT